MLTAGSHLLHCFAPLVEAFFDLLFHALVSGLVIEFFHSQVILGDEMVGMIVRVDIAFTVTQTLGAFVARIAQVFRNGQCGYASAEASRGGTKLGILAMPQLSEIARDPQFEPVEITCEEFEGVWARMGFTEEVSLFRLRAFRFRGPDGHRRRLLRTISR